MKNDRLAGIFPFLIAQNRKSAPDSRQAVATDLFSIE
jgi:hypothetical protein